MRPIRYLLGLLSLLVLALPLHADSLASYSGGVGTNILPTYYGQSFRVAGAGSYNNITFSFLSPNGSATAAGTGYLFSQAYTGTVANLSTAATNLLGTATAKNGVYGFAANLLLTSGMEYFFYSDYRFPSLSIRTTVLPDGSASKDLAFALSSGSNFTPLPQTTNFRVNGTAASVTPEPSSLMLLGMGALGMLGAARRRFAR